MKIKNVDEFRKELFSNLKEMYFCCFDMYEVSENYFESDETNKNHVIKLHNALLIENTTFDPAKINLSYYVTVSEFGDIDVWETNYDEHYFKWRTGTCASDIKNKNIAMMETVKILMNILY